MGGDFAARVQSAVESILQDPERFAAYQFRLRAVPVSRFPYLVLFVLTDREVLFLGVVHTARAIRKWLAQRGGSVERP